MTISNNRKINLRRKGKPLVLKYHTVFYCCLPYTTWSVVALLFFDFEFFYSFTLVEPNWVYNNDKLELGSFSVWSRLLLLFVGRPSFQLKKKKTDRADKLLLLHIFYLFLCFLKRQAVIALPCQRLKCKITKIVHMRKTNRNLTDRGLSLINRADKLIQVFYKRARVLNSSQKK